MPQPSAAQSWLSEHFSMIDLPLAEAQEAGSFSFLWGLFEYRVMRLLGQDIDKPLTRTVIRDSANSDKIARVSLSAEKLYFKNHFFDVDNEPLNTWDGAQFRPGDRADEISELLLKEGSSFEEDAEVLIRLVLRLRNNLFHGIKWGYNMKGQKKNFETANSVLMKLMPHVG